MFSLSFTPATSSLVLRGTLVLVRRILRRGTLQGNAGETSETHTERPTQRETGHAHTPIHRDQLSERPNTERDQHRERPDRERRAQRETKHTERPT